MKPKAIKAVGGWLAHAMGGG